MAARSGRIYVETLIRGSIDELWRRTQDPASHERWDIRFTEINYVPRPDERQPQRFRYATRIGFGLRIEGEGESVGDKIGTGGIRTSALRFWSDDPKSLIRDGSGYWQYIPTDEGVRFITAYDYRVRYGPAGRLIDRLLFRPLIGWATAWSFDCLRLWIERDIDPALSRRNSLLQLVARATVGSVWTYHGAIPKLVSRDQDEQTMLRDAGFPTESVGPLLTLIGASEVAFGAMTLLARRQRWPFLLSIVAMVFATIGVAKNSPRYLTAAFNPVTLNLLVAAVSLVGLLTDRDLPSAENCLRQPNEVER